MTVIKELMRTEDDGTLSFGDYSLDTKTKLADYAYKGDLMKVKTYKAITKLEKDGILVYESVPGTAVAHLDLQDDGMEFVVSGMTDTQITLGLEEDAQYRIAFDHEEIGTMSTSMGGKLAISVELEPDKPVLVTVKK